MHFSVALVLAVWTCMLSTVVQGAIDKDRVDNLPGLSWKVNYTQYSGYLNATGTKKLHYWFVTSQGNPSKDPLVLWLNGGPGCSSLDGLLSEHGPFLIQDDGKTLKENPHSWNKIANMLYLEAPAGVGFSYSDDQKYATDDDQVADDNHAALKYFLKGFPEFAKNEFYITGESYGGIYVPTLSARIVDDSAFNFKGFVVGNGLSSRDNNTNSQIYFAYYHGLVSPATWKKLQTCCPQGADGQSCDFPKGTSSSCRSAVKTVNDAVGSNLLNIYNLFGTCYVGSVYDTSKQGNKIVYHDFGWMGIDHSKTKKHREQLMSYGVHNLKLVPPCIDASGLEGYLNRPEVRRAIHIPDSVPKWEICSSSVGFLYRSTYDTVREQYLKVLSTKKHRIMVYNGDGDMACNFLGDEWFVEELQQKVIFDTHAWYYTSKDMGNQIGGFFKEYENIVFVTVKGAGHMVPQDKPVEALTMFTNYIQNRDWL